MRQQNPKWVLLAPALAAMALLLIQPLRADVIEKTKKVGGKRAAIRIGGALVSNAADSD